MNTLFQIEFRKMLKRKAFWVALALFGGFLTLIYWNMFARGGGVAIEVNKMKLTLNSSQWWGFMFGFPGINVVAIAAFFVPITVVMLAASEFTFKTARQNVIDGLTRGQFLLAKVVSVLFVALAYFLVVMALGLYFGYVRADATQLVNGFIRTQELQMLGAYFLMLVGYGLLALLFSLMARSSGAAIGLFFFYTIMVEQMLSQLFRLSEATKWLADAIVYAPGPIFKDIIKPDRYDNAGIMSMLGQMGRSMNGGAEPLATNTVLACALGYVVLLSAASYLLVKRTDL